MTEGGCESLDDSERGEAFLLLKIPFCVLTISRMEKDRTRAPAHLTLLLSYVCSHEFGCCRSHLLLGSTVPHVPVMPLALCFAL